MVTVRWSTPAARADRRDRAGRGRWSRGTASGRRCAATPLERREGQRRVGERVAGAGDADDREAAGPLRRPPAPCAQPARESAARTRHPGGSRWSSRTSGCSSCTGCCTRARPPRAFARSGGAPPRCSRGGCGRAPARPRAGASRGRRRSHRRSRSLLRGSKRFLRSVGAWSPDLALHRPFQRASRTGAPREGADCRVRYRRVSSTRPWRGRDPDKDRASGAKPPDSALARRLL